MPRRAAPPAGGGRAAVRPDAPPSEVGEDEMPPELRWDSLYAGSRHGKEPELARLALEDDERNHRRGRRKAGGERGPPPLPAAVEYPIGHPAHWSKETPPPIDVLRPRNAAATGAGNGAAGGGKSPRGAKPPAGRPVRPWACGPSPGKSRARSPFALS